MDILPRPVPRRPARALVALAVATVAVGACDDPVQPIRENVRSLKATVFAVNGSPPGFPVAVNVLGPSTLGLNVDLDFDVAFDLDAAGRVVLVPQKLVGLPLASARVIGLQRSAVPYRLLDEAPRTGWVYDSTLTLAVGETALIQSGSEYCSFQQSSVVHAKLAVDSVRRAARQLWISVAVNPNCGVLDLTLDTTAVR
jgi:hypothetical protein